MSESILFPRVGVLLAAYNGMRWLPDQIDSIRSQRGVCVHLIISVDRSDDETLAWCEAFAQAHSDVSVLPVGRFGGAGRNFFRLLRDVSFEGFEYIALADQDDLWLPDKLVRAVESIRRHEVSAYSSNVTAFWADGRQQLISKAQPQRRWDHLFEAAGPGCTYVLTSSLANAFKAFLYQHWESVQAVTLHDWLIYAFAREHQFLWYIDSEPGMLYRQHGSNEVGANTSMRTMLLRWKRIREGWWLGQVIRIAALVVRDPHAPLQTAVLGRSELFRMLCVTGQSRRRMRDRLLFAGVCVWALFGGVKLRSEGG